MAQTVDMVTQFCQSLGVVPVWNDAPAAGSWQSTVQVQLPDGSVETAAGSGPTIQDARQQAGIAFLSFLASKGLLLTKDASGGAQSDATHQAALHAELGASAAEPPLKRPRLPEMNEPLGGPAALRGQATRKIVAPKWAGTGQALAAGPTVAEMLAETQAAATAPAGVGQAGRPGFLPDILTNVIDVDKKNPVQVLNEYCQKLLCKAEWTTLQRGGLWSCKLTLRGPNNAVLTQVEGSSAAKREAMGATAQLFIQKSHAGIRGEIVGGAEAAAPVAASTPQWAASGALPTIAAPRGLGQVAAPLGNLPKIQAPRIQPPKASMIQALVQQPGAFGQAKEEKWDFDTFGYTMSTGRMRLNEYLTQRNLPLDIPTEGSGPFKAKLDIRLHGAKGWIRAESTAGNKKDAQKQVALKVVSELCKKGELQPFREKQEAEKELSVQPQSAAIKPGVEQQLDRLLHHMGVPPDVQAIMCAMPGRSILRDFDAAAWATNPDAREVCHWFPPAWGKSPWGSATEAYGDENDVNSRLLQEMDVRDQSPAYRPTRKARSELPIAVLETDIIDRIEKNAVTLVSGSTGCGKTTQLPQMLLERAILRGVGTSTNIAVTQPRRIAAITVAERVAKERGEQKCGASVGYNVRFSKVLPRPYASICYMTPGMLLRWLVTNGMRHVSHLIVDEVHERDLDTDFLLTVIQKMLRVSPGLKVILMSATIDLEKWGSYFHTGLATVEIPGRLHPVDMNYLEEVHSIAGGSILAPSKADQSEDVPVDVVERLIGKLVATSLAAAKEVKGDLGAILVFFPGWESISSVQKRLQANADLMRKIKLHILHSQVPKEEQQAAFLAPPPPLVKVVLSTNIAESSVTISDVVYVIDSCRVKQLTAQQAAGAGTGRVAYRLMNVPASKQSLQQRAGRAGRVRPGMCFRLIKRSEFEALPECLFPDMVRLPLHQVTLTVKSLNLGGAEEFLTQAPDPPQRMAIRQSVQVLQDLKALDQMERITDLGKKLAKLPTEPRMGFALVASCMLGLGEPMALVSALASSPPLYHNEKMRGRDLAASGQPQPSMQLMSDHHEALVTFYRLSAFPQFQREMVCNQNGINYKSFRYVAESSEQTIGMLRQMQFDPEATASCKDWIMELGTANETDEHRQLWAALSLLFGIGLEHFALRKGFGRKVWTGAAKTSTVTISPGVSETLPVDPLRPFVLFAELRETEWQSKCSGVTSAGAVATILGAARDLSYDRRTQCLMVDGWAPVQMMPVTAARLLSVRLAIRMCLLNMSQNPKWLIEDPGMSAFRALLFDLARPWDVSQADAGTFTGW